MKPTTQPGIMHIKLSNLLIGAFLLCIAPVAGAQDRTFSSFDYSDGSRGEYDVILPRNFDPAKTYPVAICPSEVDPDEPESWCYRDLEEDHQWILIGTQVLWSRRDGSDAILDLFAHLKERFRVEGGRFHIAGFSANSGPTFQAVLAHPEAYASVTGVPGHPRSTNSEELTALSGVRVQLIVGTDDGFWLRASEQALTRLEGLGISVSLERIENGGHVLRSVFGDPLMRRLDQLRPSRDN